MLERLDSDPTALETEGERERPIAPVWIPATLGVGLLIAALYLGGRILTGHSAAPAPVKTVTAVAAKPAAAAAVQGSSQPTLPAPLPQPEAETPPQPEEVKRVLEDRLPMIAPQAGERYIQVAAVATLGVEETRRYIAELRHAQIDAHLAPGPRPELLRVLIGPFANQDALEQTKSELARAGIKNFVRKY